MAKILSKSGDSLADVYDVRGSIAGIDELQSKDVNLVHEMGSTVFSERLSARIFQVSSGAIAQSVAFDVSVSFVATARLISVCLITDQAARVSNVQFSILSPPGIDDSEVPIYAWNSTDSTRLMRILVGGSVVTRSILLPSFGPNVPNLLIGSDSPREGGGLSMRGAMNAFGAGTAQVQALVQIAFAELGGVSSRGLPIPSW